MLDYGCGSGILAIAAAKLGAGAVVGVDIDPQALEAARANSRANGVDASYTDSHGLSQSATTFDVVLANILSNPLKLLAPALVARVAPRRFTGAVRDSRTAGRRGQRGVSRARRHSWHSAPWRSEDGWVCLAGTRAPTAH